MATPYNWKRNQEIYDLVNSQEFTYQQLGDKYKTHRSNIYRIFHLHKKKLKQASKTK